MATPAQSKILRLALVEGSKIVDEKHFKRPTNITIGSDGKNTFIVPASNIPPSITLFEYKSPHYSLVFGEKFDGRVRVGNADVNFQSLIAQGLAKKRGNAYVYPLNDSAKGKVSIGGVTLLFQFVAPPPEPPRAELPAAIKGSIWQSMDHLFFGILAASLFLHFSGAACIMLSPRPEEREVGLDELPDRFAKLLVPVKLPEPEKVPEAKKEDDEKKKEAKKEEAKKPEKVQNTDVAARKVEIQNKVAQKGLLKILGSSGSGGGAFEDVLGSGTGAGDIANALQGAGGVGVATADSIGAGGPKGGGSGKVAGIGDLGTSGGGNVNLGNKGDVKVSGRVKEAAPEVDSADVDRDALARYVKARLKAIQNCYEKELKRNPTLKGKVVVRFSITKSGRAGEVEIEENSLGNEAVASCIRTVIRAWIFPFKPEDDVPVAYPFVFSPAS